MNRSKGFAVLAALAVLGVLFADPDSGDFRLALDSPAIGAGDSSLLHSEIERVPADDFEGDPRPAGLPAIGFDERP